MKIVTILGSPRKRGNTAAALRAFEALVTPQHIIDRINITDYRVAGCLGCDACQDRLDAPGCCQKDDADLIQVMFDREIAYVRGVVVGKYVVANCTTPAELGERATETARRMAQEIIHG